jgi:hypothetical protein
MAILLNGDLTQRRQEEIQKEEPGRQETWLFSLLLCAFASLREVLFLP